jgi:hydroxyethylthiazole kinase
MEKIKGKEIWDLWRKIQAKKPLVHCITNIVTVNDCANIVLAAGGSPTMAHHPLEVAEIAEGCDSLVLNMGATESYEAMLVAGKAANRAGRPIILDPVGASGAGYRREKTKELIEALKPAVIRGNFSEIRALATDSRTQIGVDAALFDTGDEDLKDKRAELVADYAKKTNAIVIASGKTDIISDGEKTGFVTNGSELMSKITGSGCMETALLGAFFGTEASYFSALCACLVMGLCGEIAEEKTKENNGGTMTFRMHLIDSVSTLSEKSVLPFRFL